MALEVGTNSYISVGDADAYFADRLGSEAWTSGAEDKDKVLIAATRAVERLRFVGRRKEALQPLQFPRCYATGQEHRRVADALEEDGLLAHFRGDPVRWECETETPKAVLDAVCEEALHLLKAQGDAQAELRRNLQRQGVIAAKIGSTSESYDGSGAGPSVRSADAEALLAPYVAAAGGFG